MAQENMEGIFEGSSEATGKLSVLQPCGSTTSFVHSEDGETAISVCKNCNTVLKDTGCKHGTSTLKRHSDGCSRDDYGPPAKQQRPAPFSEEDSSPAPQADHPGWFNQEECAAELVQMIAFHGYPSSIVEDDCFRHFLRSLNPSFQMPSRAAVEGICHSHAQEAMTQLKKTLARCPGKVSLATGVADTGGEGRALYMACQFVDDDWVFQKRIMQVFRAAQFPPYNHSALLGGAVEVCLDVPERVLEQFSLPTTSAVLEEEVRRWGLLPGRLFSVAWCQELYQERGLRRHGSFLDQVVPVVTYTSEVLDSVAASIHKALDGNYEVACLDTLRGLQLSHEKRARRFSELGLNHVGRYDKRWYSYYCALEVLHKEHSEHNPALLAVEEDDQGPAGFSESELTEMLSEIRVSRERQPPMLKRVTKKKPSRHKESLFTDLLRNIFGTIYRAIEAVSSPGCATASLCLGEVKKVRDVVQSEAMDACRNVPKAIAYSKGGFGPGEDANVVLLEAQGMLDKFLEDSYVHLSIPAVLDPRFKLEGVRNIFSEVFDESAGLGPDNFSIVAKKIEDMFRDYIMTGGASPAAMHVDGTSQQSVTMDELERYLEDGVVVHHGGEAQAAGGFDVLQWWKENEVRYPTVARMARDALAMPASDLRSPQHLCRIRSMARSYCCVTYPSNMYTS